MNSFLAQLERLNANAVEAGQLAEARARQRQRKELEPVREVKETEPMPGQVATLGVLVWDAPPMMVQLIEVLRPAHSPPP